MFKSGVIGIFQFALVHYFTKVGSGEYYLDDLEQTDCQAENIKNRKALNESSVSIVLMSSSMYSLQISPI